MERHQKEHMAFERIFTRVVGRLLATDAIALAPQREKVINRLHKELLAEGVLVEEEGEVWTEKRGMAASPQKDFSVSVGTEPLTGTFYNQHHVQLCV